MDLHQIVDRFALERDVSRGYVYQLHLVVVNYARHLQHMPVIADLTDDAINRWLLSLTESGLSRRSVRSKRSHLLALWRFAVSARLVRRGPSRVRPIKCSKLIPDASRPEKLALLLAEARKMAGVFKKSRVCRADFFVALILVAWRTGLRLGDLLKIERSNISEVGVLTIVQNKTGDPIVRPLCAESLAAVDAICSPDRRRIFGDALSRGHVQKGMRRLLAKVGLKGGLKRIRRSGATAVERAQKGAAMRYLGHRTPGLAYEFYVDPRLLDEDRPTPPPLE